MFGADGAAFTSKLNLVDLAGSERAAKTGAVGATAREANHINKSLTFLEQASQHRPWVLPAMHICMLSDPAWLPLEAFSSESNSSTGFT